VGAVAAYPLSELKRSIAVIRTGVRIAVFVFNVINLLIVFLSLHRFTA
jgi:hypothetical protein